MITGVHTMFYTSQPESLRQFIRDKLGFSFTDVGGGWLIFDLPEADMGCHPAEGDDGQPSGTHHISFYCDDIKKTVAELRSRGVEFVDTITDLGYGLVTHFRMPGDFDVQLYEPKYAKTARHSREGIAALIVGELIESKIIKFEDAGRVIKIARGTIEDAKCAGDD